MSDTALKLLTEWAPFSYDTKSIKESREQNGGKLIMKGILQKADTLNQNGRMYPRDILEREVRNYQKFIRENRALGECVDAETTIHTKRGWVSIGDVKKGDVVFTLNLETNKIEEQPVLHKTEMFYEGEMLHFMNGGSLDMMLTPDHKFLLWDRKNLPSYLPASKVADLASDRSSWLSHSYLRYDGDWNIDNDETTFTPPGCKISVDKHLWAAFMGIYLAEGCADGVKRGFAKTNNIQITQKKSDVIVAIRGLLQQLPYDFKERIRVDGETIDFSIRNDNLHEFLYELGHSGVKYVPDYIKSWSSEYLETFMTWALLGDGRNRKDRKGGLIREYCSVSSRLASDMQEIFLKIGTGSRITTYNQADRPITENRMILAKNSQPMNIVSEQVATISLDTRFLKIDKVDYKDWVYCVTTQNGNWLARRNGKAFWTGNCDHPDSSVVELKKVSHIVREAFMDGNVCHGVVEILDTPCGKILQSLVEAGVTLGISSRGVGSTKKSGDHQIVQDDFQLICWDFVSEPSTPGAFMMREGRQIASSELARTFNRSDRIDRIFNDILTWKK